MRAIAHSYWRSIKRGVRNFSDIPGAVAEDVKALARAEVEKTVITESEYENYLGERYRTGGADG